MKKINFSKRIIRYTIRKLAIGTVPIIIGTSLFISHPVGESQQSNTQQYQQVNNYLMYSKNAIDYSFLPLLALTGGTLVTMALSSRKNKYRFVSLMTIAALGQQMITPLSANAVYTPYHAPIINGHDYASFFMNRYQPTTYKTRVTTQSVPFKIQEIPDDTLERGQRQVITQGVNGTITTTFEDKFIGGKRVSTTKKKVQQTAATNEVVHVGTLETVIPQENIPSAPALPTAVVTHQTRTEQQTIPFTTEEVLDDTLELGQRVVTQNGVNGLTTTTFDDTYVDGQVVNSVQTGTQTIPATNEVVHVGTLETAVPQENIPSAPALPTAVVTHQTRTEQQTIPFTTEEVPDDNLELNQRQVSQDGIDGVTTTTFDDTYVEGQVVNSVQTNTQTTPATNEVVHVGTLETAVPQANIPSAPALPTAEISHQTRTEQQAIPFTTEEVLDDTLELGQRQVTQSGVNGQTTTTFDDTYVDGQVVNSVQTSTQTIPATNEIVRVGTLTTTSHEPELKHVEQVALMYKNDDKYQQKFTLESVPTTFEDYFVKIETKELKDLLLPIQNAQEVQKNGQTFIKLTTSLPQNADYDVYIQKTPTNVQGFTSFKSLVEAININPTGTFTLASDLSADEVTPTTSYITKAFKGTLSGGANKKQFAIHNLKMPLFDTLNGATIQHIDFKNVNIMTTDKNIAAIAKTANNAAIIDTSVQGNITASANIGGLVAHATSSELTNTAFHGNINATNPDTISQYGGLVGKAQNSTISQSFVDVKIDGDFHHKNMRVGGIVGLLESGAITNVYAKGKINSTSNGAQIGGIVGSTYINGKVDQAISMMKGNAYMIHGDTNFNQANIKNTFYVTGVASGQSNQWGTGITYKEAQNKIRQMGIFATLKDSSQSQLLNHKTVNYQKIPKAQQSRQIAYYNVEKLTPFYNAEMIVQLGNSIQSQHKLYKTKLRAVIPMHNNTIISDMSQQINKLMLHYEDNTIAYINLIPKNNQQQLSTYQLQGTQLVYTPQYLTQASQSLIEKLLPDLNSVNYYSENMLNALGYHITPEEISTNNKQQIIQEKMGLLYLEQSFNDVKSHLNQTLNKVLSTSYLSNTNSNYIVDYIKTNKEKLLLGLAYMQRWYNINFDQMNIQELATYHQDFYGQSTNSLEWLVTLANFGYNSLLPKNNVTLYSQAIAPYTKQNTITDYLSNQRHLFTQLNAEQWFKKATKAQLVTTPSQENKKINVNIYQRLAKPNSKFKHMILPLLTLSKEGVYVISNINALEFGMYDKYMDMDLATTDPQTYQIKLQEVKAMVNRAALWQRDYFDTWYRILKPELKEKLIRDVDVWDAYYIESKDTWLPQYGATSQTVLDFFGPVDHYYEFDGNGAYSIEDTIDYVADKMLDMYGNSVYTHEMVHANDQSIYLQYGRRQHMGPESYAYGLLQTPDLPVIGLNFMFSLPKSNKLNHNATPQRFQNAEDIQTYMRGSFDLMYTLNYIEAMSLVNAGKTTQKLWFNKIENTSGNNVNNIVRPLTDTEWHNISLSNINDFIDNGLISKREYRIDEYDRNGYYTTRLFSPIFGTAENNNGAPGGLSFRQNAFELLAYKGYYDGFVPYVSNQYYQQAVAEGHTDLSDQFLIKKISNGQYNTLTEFKKAMYQERIDKLDKLKPITITYNNKNIRIASQQALQKLMNEAVATDLKNNTIVDMANSEVIKLKQAIYHAYLTQTKEFKQSIFKP